MNQISFVVLVGLLLVIWMHRTSGYSDEDSTYTGGDFGIVVRNRA
jgi:hypothetical protein